MKLCVFVLLQGPAAEIPPSSLRAEQAHPGGRSRSDPAPGAARGPGAAAPRWALPGDAGSEVPGPIREPGTVAAASPQEDARQGQGGRRAREENSCLVQVKISFGDSNPWNEEFDAPT